MSTGKPSLSNDDGISAVDAPQPATHGDAGGVYYGRAVSHELSPLHHSREGDIDCEEGDEWKRDDGRKKQVFRGKVLLWLAYQSIGAIYGDIGTSPLYVYSSTFTSAPSKRDVTNVLSVIIWSLTIMVTLKYITIILRADNEGEGGTFSTYNLLTRYVNLTQRDPRDEVTVKMERYMTNDIRPSTRGIRSTLENSFLVRGLLKVIGVLSVSMVLADGILTPAQSVLGAIQGLEVVKPDISSSVIVGTSCAILVVLFLIQPFGTSKLASLFAPIVIIWLGLNGSFGIYNLVKYDYSVLKAFSPAFAIDFFRGDSTEAWKMLGGVLLAFTGVEALFADLGAFSMNAIQLSWLSWAFPCLLLAYAGQAARIAVEPELYSNPFFNTVPPGMLYPSLVFAILAAVVASQAMITAAFQLTSQIMKLSYCPQVKIVHTSKTFHGQLYVPFLNWILLGGSVLVTAVYSNTTRLGAAYGVCVMFVTFFDTCMVTLVALFVWKLPIYVVVVPWLIFASIDGLYLSSALNKVPDGAWFTLMVAGILAFLFLLWRYGKENQWRAESSGRIKLSKLVSKDDTGKMSLTSTFGGEELQRIAGFAIYFDKTGTLLPSVFIQFVSKLKTLPETAVFLHFHPVETPTVPFDERYAVSRYSGIPGCYRLVIRHGFMDEIMSPDLGALVYEQLRQFVARSPRSTGQSSQVDLGEDTSTSKAKNGLTEKITVLPNLELSQLEHSYAQAVLYIIGKGQMRVPGSMPFVKKVLLLAFLWIRENTRMKIANLRLNMERVLEVGFVSDL